MLLPWGQGRPVTGSRSTPRSAPGGSQVPRSRSMDRSIRHAPPRGPVDTILISFEKATTAIHTEINEEQTSQDEERFAALDKGVVELLSEKFQTF